MPRSGSTLLSQLLGEHPDVFSEGHTSPLCNSLVSMRRQISSDPSYLSQLDIQFNISYSNLKNAMIGFIDGWFQSSGTQIRVDKNRDWLRSAELLFELIPSAKIIITVRELGQIYGSIENQHQKTILLEYTDPLAILNRYDRAEVIFGKHGVVGSHLYLIRGIQDLPKWMRDRIFIIRFEDLINDPIKQMNILFDEINLTPFDIDPTRLNPGLSGSDSHYRYKFLHNKRSRISAPKVHEVPERIDTLIKRSFGWYHEWFYADDRENDTKKLH